MQVSCRWDTQSICWSQQNSTSRRTLPSMLMERILGFAGLQETQTPLESVKILLRRQILEVSPKIPAWKQHLRWFSPNPTKNQNGNFTAFMPVPVNATRNDVFLPNTIIPLWLYITCHASVTHSLLHPFLIHFIPQISRSLSKTLCFLTIVIQREQNSLKYSIIKNKSVIMWMIKINGKVLQLVPRQSFQFNLFDIYDLKLILMRLPL